MGSLIARIKGDLRTGSPLLACQASVHGGAAEGLQVAAHDGLRLRQPGCSGARYDARNPQALKRLVTNEHCCARSAKL